MFEWVKVWLDICISERNLPKTTLQSSIVAKKLLKQLNEDSSHESEGFEHMEQAYNRLWSLNSTTDSDELGTMKRLFEYVLAAENSLSRSSELLAIALRIRSDDYDSYPSPEDVQALSSNFLEFKFGKASFVHSSAKYFIMNKLCPRNTSESEDRRGWEGRLSKQTNKSLTALYLDIMSSETQIFPRVKSKFQT